MGPAEIVLLPCVAVAALIILVPILALVFLLKGSPSRHGGVNEQEQYRLAQQIHADLERMEKRVEALEEILLDRTRKG